MKIDKELLLEKIRTEIPKLEKKIENYRDLTQPISPENAIGRVSRMDAINNKSVLENGLRNAEKKLQQLKRVQERINDRDFGICIQCKQSIPIPRIMIQPGTRYCVNCAN